MKQPAIYNAGGELKMSFQLKNRSLYEMCKKNSIGKQIAVFF